MPAECPNRGRFGVDTDASLFAVGRGGGGGVLNQLQEDREVVIACSFVSATVLHYMPVGMFTHFRSYLRGAQFILRTDHSSLRWLQKFRNSDDMLARWYMLLGHFSVTFEYRPGAQHANADGLSRPIPESVCGGLSGVIFRHACRQYGFHNGIAGSAFCILGHGGLHGRRLISGTVWRNVGGSHLSGRTYGGFTVDRFEPDFIVASRRDKTLATGRQWVQTGAPPAWPECSGLSRE